MLKACRVQPVTAAGAAGLACARPTLPSAAVPDPLIGRVIGGCSLERLLGRGGIGAVYRARTDEARPRTMAIKVLSPQASDMPALSERFEREARLCYQLQHPSIVAVHTWGRSDDGLPFMIMDFVDGATLASLVHKKGRLEWTIAASIVADIASAVHHVHELEILHRDLKPANVLVSRQGRGVLTDLGLARQVVDSLDESSGRRLTAPGSALGSPAFMAPEQVTDTAGVTAAADLYGLAASLFYAITGRPPLIAETASATIMKVLRDDPPPIGDLCADLPPAVADLIDACLAKDPARRSQRAEDFARVLRRELRAAGYREPTT